MTEHYGYVGKMLKVDLSTQSLVSQSLPHPFAKAYIGGTGICARLLYDELPADVEPLSAENIVIFATGPVTGTFYPPSGRYMIATRSPLTGAWLETHAGGAFGPELKYAGYDLVFITGRAPEPVYLHVEDGAACLRAASHLWGKDTIETTDSINEELGACRVAAIGPAGENLVRYACVINDKHRAAGRGGVGAVLGSKRLKALAVKGTGSIEVYDYDVFMRIAEEARDRYTKGTWGVICQASLGTVGTTGLVEAASEIGRLPTKNHCSGIYEDYEKIGSVAIRARYRKKRKSCFNCGIQCKYVSVIDDGKYAGTVCEGPEYESIMAFGSNALNDDLASVIHANYLCNLYGLDTISMGTTLSFLMECEEKGICAYGLEWGDADGMIELIHKTARREGLGDKLAEGSLRLARGLGKGAERYAIHVKGMEVSGQDGRPHKSIGLALAISVRGADHLRAISSLDELGYEKVTRRRFGARAAEILELRSERGKGILIADMEELYAIVDSLITCKYGTMWPPMFYFEDYAALVPALTGIDELGDVKELRRAARRICLLRRAFNARLGLRRKDDMLPRRMLEERMPSGPAKNELVELEPMLDEFYEQRGCDTDGVPTEKALGAVGLDAVAKDLKSRGISC